MQEKSSKKGRFHRLRTTLVAFALLVGTGAVAVTLTASPAAAAIVTSSIADQAETFADGAYAYATNGVQCKAFVGDVVRDVTGSYPSGYQTGFANAGATEITDPAAATRGDIIQITPAGSTDATAESLYTAPYTSSNRLHTTIIRAPRNTDGTFNVIDSNWGNDQKVMRHTFDPYVWASGSIVKIWRFGTAGATGVAAISSQVDGAGVQHVYAAVGTKLYDVSWGNGAPLVQWLVKDLGVNITRVSSQIDAAGVQHVFAVTGAAVQDVSWGNGNPVTSWQVGNFPGATVTDLSSQYVGGVFHVYAGTSTGGINEIAWGNGQSLVQWQVTNLGASVTSLSSKYVSGGPHVYASAGTNVYDVSWGNGNPVTVWSVWNAGGSVSRVSSQLDSGGVQHVLAAIGTDVYDISWGNGAPLTRWRVGYFPSLTVKDISSQYVGGVFHVFAGTSNGGVNEIAWGGGQSLTQWQVTSVGALTSVSSQITSGVSHVYTAVGSNVKDVSWGNGNPVVAWQVGTF
ncbi:MAG TPA: hypothetical protein VLF67_04415 [Candidatus Saccharimonas sp.]|nr:hypothetical protein [Candidatus Saccharimonas sp.]